ncbi:MAG: hypothetical protein KGL39_28845 [Patescibacteria group bacterium]|nr:hypothetical protein [Patescibacteria group bacterium]
MNNNVFKRSDGAWWNWYENRVWLGPYPSEAKAERAKLGKDVVNWSRRQRFKRKK